jgi:hypothetical protein
MTFATGKSARPTLRRRGQMLQGVQIVADRGRETHSDDALLACDGQRRRGQTS